MNLWFQIKG